MTQLLVTLVLLVSPTAPTELKEKANALIEKKDYAKACPMLKKVAEAAPKEGSGWAELGACLVLQKKNKDATAASLKAINLENADARHTAYLTLSLVGVEKKLPSAQPDEEKARCGSVASNAGCKTPVIVCNTATADTTETRDTRTETKIGFGLNEAEALANQAKNTFSRSQHRGSEGFDTECVLVAVDGCNKRAAIVCTTSNAASAEPKTDAIEIDFH
jgi:tetratricopeptide (TPR) repeat protein